MAKADGSDARQEADEIEETRSLLSQGSDDIDNEPPKSSSPVTGKRPSPLPYLPRRQSSFAQPRPQGEPRTPNRVRFDVEAQVADPEANGHADPHWVDEEDFLADAERRDSDVQRLPLLTDIEAPSVTVASADVGFNAEDLLESARPKSGMRSAFMNMANSIM